ncbi:unnamed protein product [Polarella glacialis]|uniref:Uncharacterized protein n=1 Tax=Polarella glacialis TaxID=89957 RepID=A0A813DZ35_POLGL|nr:unnamed protein product [Polarella glacialis]
MASGVDAFGEVDAVGASSGSQSLSFFEARQAPGDTLLVPPGWWQQELHEAGPTISVVSQLLNEQAFLEMTAGLLRAAGRFGRLETGTDVPQPYPPLATSVQRIRMAKTHSDQMTHDATPASLQLYLATVDTAGEAEQAWLELGTGYTEADARGLVAPRKKQGWECPAPSVEIFLADFSLLFHQDKDVKMPWIHRIKCELPHRVGRLSGDLPVKAGSSNLHGLEDYSICTEVCDRWKASYIGFGTRDAPEGYELFKQAMAEIGVVLCRQIHYPLAQHQTDMSFGKQRCAGMREPNRFELAHLEQSDLILVGGGDRRRLWETLGTDLGGRAGALEEFRRDMQSSAYAE